MILINQDKAIEIAKDKVRVYRTNEFKANDLAIQNALLEGADTSALIARRDYLRNLPDECTGKSIEELEALIITLGA
jgi:hypothetical protein